METITYFFIFFLSLIITLLSLPYLIKYLVAANIVDVPGERRVNRNVIPRMGGIIIYITEIVMIFIFYHNYNVIIPVLLTSLIIAGCGIFDDVIGLKWNYKFLLEITATVIFLVYLFNYVQSVKVFGILLPFPLNIIITGIFILGALNAINMMDGLDGLVAGFALQVMWMILIIAVLTKDSFIVIASLALLGSIFGFLRYNAYPAQIFLGDTGSLTIGYFIIIFSMLVSMRYTQNNLDLTFPIIMLGVPIFDTLRVMVYRILRKSSPFKPDLTHLHHLMINGRVRHKTTVALILGFSSLCAMLSLLYLKKYVFTSEFIFLILGIIIFSIKPILIRLSRIVIFIKLRQKLIQIMSAKWFPDDGLFVLITFSFSMVVILSALPARGILKFNLWDIVIIPILTMLVIYISRRSRKSKIKDIYVIINLSIYFLASSFSGSLHDKLGIPLQVWNIIKSISLVGLTLYLILFLIQRNKKITGNGNFLTGWDLIAVISLISIYIVNVIFSYTMFGHIGYLLVETIIIFLWYKMITYRYSWLSEFLYYLSFGLPVISIIMIVIYST